MERVLVRDLLVTVVGVVLGAIQFTACASAASDPFHTTQRLIKMRQAIPIRWVMIAPYPEESFRFLRR